MHNVRALVNGERLLTVPTVDTPHLAPQHLGIDLENPDPRAGGCSESADAVRVVLDRR